MEGRECHGSGSAEQGRWFDAIPARVAGPKFRDSGVFIYIYVFIHLSLYSYYVCILYYTYMYIAYTYIYVHIDCSFGNTPPCGRAAFR